VSLAHALLGRREPRGARSDLVYGIAAARLTLEIELELVVRAAAVAFEVADSPELVRVGAEVEELLAGIEEDTGARAALHDDSFGFRWITLSGASLEDLALAIGVVAEALESAGCWEQLLCAVFAFERAGAPADTRVNWVYNFASGKFYAFIPVGLDGRDTDEERRLHEAVASELRLEPDSQRRHPIRGL
jgi:hypothetical protein